MQAHLAHNTHANRTFCDGGCEGRVNGVFSKQSGNDFCYDNACHRRRSKFMTLSNQKKYLKNWIRLWFGVHNTNDHRKTFSSYFCLFLFELVHEQHNQDTAIDRQFGCASIYLNSVSRPLNLYFYQKLIPFGWQIDGYKQQFWRKFTEMCLSCIIFRICILKCFSECSRIVFYVGLFQVNRHKFWGGGYGKCAMIAIVSAMSHWSLDWIWIIIYVWVCRSYRSRCFVSTSSMQIVNCTRYP